MSDAKHVALLPVIAATGDTVQTYVIPEHVVTVGDAVIAKIDKHDRTDHCEVRLVTGDVLSVRCSKDAALTALFSWNGRCSIATPDEDAG